MPAGELVLLFCAPLYYVPLSLSHQSKVPLHWNANFFQTSGMPRPNNAAVGPEEMCCTQVEVSQLRVRVLCPPQTGESQVVCSQILRLEAHERRKQISASQVVFPAPVCVLWFESVE